MSKTNRHERIVYVLIKIELAKNGYLTKVRTVCNTYYPVDNNNFFKLYIESATSFFLLEQTFRNSSCSLSLLRRERALELLNVHDKV